jgi:L-aspartate oxidase
VHGANRLASNSLLEGLVFAHRIAEDLVSRLAAGELPPTTPMTQGGEADACDAAHRPHIQAAMTAGSGAVRSAETLAATAAELDRHADLAPTEAQPGPRTWETTNLLHLGQALTFCAMLREETRGGHVRSDHPDRSPRWRGHLHSRRQPDGTLAVWFAPVPTQAVVVAADAQTAEHKEHRP